MKNSVASNGWLESFCGRHDLTLKSICGEFAEVNLDDIEDHKNKNPLNNNSLKSQMLLERLLQIHYMNKENFKKRKNVPHD